MKSVLVFYSLFLVNYALGEFDRIAGGKKAKKDQFPFFAQIYVGIKFEAEITICGGSLIRPQWILTAAHCFPSPISFANELAQKSRIAVAMGTNKVFDENGTKNYIAEVRNHPKFILEYLDAEKGVVSKLENDVAVARLKRPYELNDHIQTVGLPNLKGKPGSRCAEGIIVGTGKTSFTSDPSEFVLYANIHTKERADVVSPLPKFEKNRSTVFYSEEKWYKEHVLQDYAGGPYVCYNLDAATQYGVCSKVYITTTRNKTIITVYESVDKHLDFILEYTSVRLGSVGLASEHTTMVIWIVCLFI